MPVDGDGVDPATNPLFPPELLEHIASFSDTETHAVLGAVCHAFVDLSRRCVFKHLTANRMESLRISHLVNELAGILESPLCTISPHVRHLTLQQPLPYRGGLPDGVLRRLPNLTSLTVEGTEDEPCILPDLQPISHGILPLAALTLKYANVVSFSIIAHALVALPRLQSLCLYEISDQDTDGSSDELIPNPPEGTLAQLQSLDCIMERDIGARLLRRFLTWVLALPTTPPILALDIRLLGAQPDLLLLVRDLVQRLQPTLTEWRIDPDEGDYFMRIERESRASAGSLHRLSHSNLTFSLSPRPLLRGLHLPPHARLRPHRLVYPLPRLW
ncbi:hypothetical protein EV715DRAFT_214407 [Schizophyllum commune]